MKKIYKWIALAFSLLMLTACGSQTYNVNIKKDGQIAFEALITRTDSLDQTLTETGITESEFSETVAKELNKYKKLGFDTSYEEKTIRVAKTYKNASDFTREMQGLYSQNKSSLNIRLDEENVIFQRTHVASGSVSYYIPPSIRKQVNKMNKEEIENLEAILSTMAKENVALNIYYPSEAKIKFKNTGIKGTNYISFLSNSNDILNKGDNEYNIGFQSVVTNTTAFYVAGGIVLFIALIIVIVVLKRRRDEKEEQDILDRAYKPKRKGE